MFVSERQSRASSFLYNYIFSLSLLLAANADKEYNREIKVENSFTLYTFLELIKMYSIRIGKKELIYSFCDTHGIFRWVILFRVKGIPDSIHK